MSTAVLPAPVSTRDAEARPGLGRLVLVELRKMTDTRSGFWLLLVTALLTVAVTVVAGLVLEDRDAKLLNFFAVALVPASLLLPIVGILARHVGVDAADGDDLVRARAAPVAGAAREAARGHGPRADRAADRARDRPRRHGGRRRGRRRDVVALGRADRPGRRSA